MVKKCVGDRLVALAVESKGADRRLHFSLKKDRFSSRYDWYGYRIQKRATEVMTSLGLHEFTLGRWDASRGQGNESTARGTEATMDWVMPLIADVDAEPQEYPESILLKSRLDKALIEYDDTAQTIEMSHQVDRINDTLGSQVLFGADGNQLHFKPGSRQFLDDFETGGGFFYSLQNTAKLHRRQWCQLVGAEKRAMVEVDIEAAHLTMLYALAGKPPPEGDPYEIPGYPRLLSKRAFNTLVNAGSTQATTGSLAHDIFQDKHGLQAACGLTIDSAFEPAIEVEEECERLAADAIRAIKVRHKAINRAFGSDVGVKLQKWLTDIMLETSDRMISKTGRCPYPIHDGAVVIDIDVDEFVKTLTDVGREHGLDLKVKTITATPEIYPKSSDNREPTTSPTTTSNHMGVHSSDLVVSNPSQTLSTTSESLTNRPPRPPDGSAGFPSPVDNPADFAERLRERTIQANAAVEHAVMPARLGKNRAPSWGEQYVELAHRAGWIFTEDEIARRNALQAEHEQWIEALRAQAREQSRLLTKAMEEKLALSAARRARQEAKIAVLIEAICDYVGAHPGANQTAIVKAMRQQAGVVFFTAEIARCFTDDVRQAIEWAGGRLRREKDGRAYRHYLVSE
ncbi:hypothetical protein A5676_04460 [Mycobacterium malmoense]|nr:hypothetical protein A5676_04460 [Mycobacterium malmoense]